MLLGGHRISKLDGELVKIEKWVTHKDAKPLSGNLPQGKWLHSGGTTNDISIVVLSKTIKLENHVLPVCLPSSDSHARESNTKGYPHTSGWGNTKLIEDEDGKIKGVSLSDVPKRVELSLTSENECDLKDMRMCDYCSRDAMLCAYGIKHFNTSVVEDSCGGDSGGNIVSFDKLRY